MFSTRLVSSSLLSLLLLAAAAQADLEIELPLGGGAMASLSDPARVDRWRLRVPGGSVLAVTVKGVKRKGGERPGLALRLLDPAGAEIATGTSNAAGARVKKLKIPTSGLYVAEVTLTGTATGDYQIKAKWKAPRKAKSVPTLAGNEVEMPFVADTGGTATFRVKGKKGVIPILVRVASADGTFTFDFVPPADGASKHKVKNVVLGPGGDYVLTVSGAGGEAKVSVKVKAPKKPKRLFTITDEVVDPGGTGDAYVRGSVIGPAGGRVEVTDDDAGLAGSAVAVPRGALSTLVPVLVGTGPEIEPADEEVVGNGPTVRFGPAGLTFGVDSRVEIPFDPEPYRGNFSELEVVQREEDGTETVVPPASYAIDADKGIVSFPVKHFTSFRVFGPAGGGEPPPPKEIFFEDFEDGWGVWWASNGVWEVGEPTSGPGAFSGSNVAGTVLAGTYPEDTHSALVTPSITLPSIVGDEEIQFRFWNWFRLNAYDSIRLDLEEELSPGDWGNSTSFDTYRLNSGAWTHSMVDLSAHAGKKVRIRFSLSQGTSGYPSYYKGVGPGWYIDEISATVRRSVDMSDGKTVTWDFEEGWGDWSSIGAHWEVGEPASGPGAAHGGANAAATILSGNYPEDSAGTLLSPSVKLPSLQAGEELHLRFWQWFSLNPYDLCRVYVREELGSAVSSAWVELARYTLFSGAWSKPLVDLTGYAGKKVRLGFTLTQGTSGYPSYYKGVGPGWYIDEVSIEKH